MGNYEYVVALFKLITEVDGLHDDLHGGKAPGLEAERELLEKGKKSAESPYNRWKFGEGFKFPWEDK